MWTLKILSGWQTCLIWAVWTLIVTWNCAKEYRGRERVSTGCLLGLIRLLGCATGLWRRSWGLLLLSYRFLSAFNLFAANRKLKWSQLCFSFHLSSMPDKPVSKWEWRLTGLLAFSKQFSCSWKQKLGPFSVRSEESLQESSFWCLRCSCSSPDFQGTWRACAVAWFWTDQINSRGGEMRLFMCMDRRVNLFECFTSRKYACFWLMW